MGEAEGEGEREGGAHVRANVDTTVSPNENRAGDGNASELDKDRGGDGKSGRDAAGVLAAGRRSVPRTPLTHGRRGEDDGAVGGAVGRLAARHRPGTPGFEADSATAQARRERAAAKHAARMKALRSQGGSGGQSRSWGFSV